LFLHIRIVTNNTANLQSRVYAVAHYNIVNQPDDFTEPTLF
jgi:hypothetical protein